MVVGSGLIAHSFSAFANNKDILIFASGVSNSKTNVIADFEREYQLIRNTLGLYKDAIFVYFSTCSIYDPLVQSSAYVRHKLEIEEFLSSNANKYVIFRLSNVVGRSKNPHTITNFISNHFNENKKLPVWKNAERNLTDIDDVFSICNHVLNDYKHYNSIINIANPVNYKMIDIIAAFEKHLNKKIPLEFLDLGLHYEIPINETEFIWHSLVQKKDLDYLDSIIYKYYGEKHLQ